MALWDDTGWASQGPILTAILQERREDAERMLHMWTVGDLEKLALAADELKVLIRQERVRQNDHRNQ